MGKQDRVLAAVVAGCETAREVEAHLDGELSPHLVAGHLSNLRRQGKIRRVATRQIVIDHRSGGQALCRVAVYAPSLG